MMLVTNPTARLDLQIGVSLELCVRSSMILADRSAIPKGALFDKSAGTESGSLMKMKKFQKPNAYEPFD